MRMRADEPLRHRKLRDRALILLLVGILLITPPVAGVFQVEARVGGVPFVLIYLFSVWAALIACAAALSRQLRTIDSARPESGESTDTTGGGG